MVDQYRKTLALAMVCDVGLVTVSVDTFVLLTVVL